MVGHGGSSAGSYLADPTSLMLSHCASIVTTSTLRINARAADGIVTLVGENEPAEICAHYDIL